jgi:Bacterial PH domain/Protein of unknown function (DUF1648)
VAGLLLFLSVAALVLGASREPGTPMLLLSLLAVVLGAAGVCLMIWAIAYRRLTYVLTDAALRIDWLGRTTVVPYAAIQGIYTGQRLEGRASPGAPRWPGISVGSARVRGLGRLRFFATSADQSQLTLITVDHGGVIVSARDPHEFRAALIGRVQQFGDVPDAQSAHVTWEEKEPTTAPWTAFADLWLPACVGLGLLALLLVLGTILVHYETLPDQVVFHFDTSGQASQIAPKSDLLRLPLFGFVCLAVNWLVGVAVHQREWLLARLLWLGGVVVQLVLFVGVLRLVA